MRFTASLRRDAAAKTVRPTGVPEKGPAKVRARPVALPTKERMRRDLVVIRSGCEVNRCGVKERWTNARLWVVFGGADEPF